MNMAEEARRQPRIFQQLICSCFPFDTRNLLLETSYFSDNGRWRLEGDWENRMQDCFEFRCREQLGSL